LRLPLVWVGVVVLLTLRLCRLMCGEAVQTPGGKAVSADFLCKANP
jgi:hypothetical protein